MPVHCELRDAKYRICETNGKISKTANGKPRDGGGHATETQCKKQARAMNANLSTASLVRPLHLNMQEPSSPVEIIYAGTFHLADRNRRLEVSEEMIDQMVANFSTLDGPDRVAINVNHNADASTLSEARAVGWLQSIYPLRQSVDGQDRYSLMGVPTWTEDAAEAIGADQFKYLSAEIHFTATDTLTGEEVGCRLGGLALTNIPAIPKLAPICLTREDQQLKVELTVLRLSERSLDEHADMVIGAFFRRFCDSNIEMYSVADLYSDHLIVEVSTGAIITGSEDPGAAKTEFYRVDYLATDTKVDFEDREKWILVEHVYQPVQQYTAQTPITLTANTTSSKPAANSGKPKDVTHMDETKIRELLGLSADADLEKELAALKARPTQEQFDAVNAELEALKTAPPSNDLNEAREQVVTLSQRAQVYEQETKNLATQVEELRQERAQRQAEDRISLAQRAGKITKAELDAEDGFMRSLAVKDATTFDKIMATRPSRPELFRELGSDQDKPAATLEVLFELIQAKQAATPDLSYDDARTQVFVERPDLKALTLKKREV